MGDSEVECQEVKIKTSWKREFGYDELTTTVYKDFGQLFTVKTMMDADHYVEREDEHMITIVFPNGSFSDRKMVLNIIEMSSREYIALLRSKDITYNPRFEVFLELEGCNKIVGMYGACFTNKDFIRADLSTIEDLLNFVANIKAR